MDYRIFGNQIVLRIDRGEEVMETLKIGKSTFYKLIHDGILKGIKEGNRYKVPLSSMEEYIGKKMNQAE